MSDEREEFEEWAASNLATGDDHVSARRAWQSAREPLLADLNLAVEALDGVLSAVNFSGWHIDDERWIKPIQNGYSALSRLSAYSGKTEKVKP